MNTFKQIILGVVIIASMFCSIMLLMMGLYLAGGVLAIVCIFCVKYAQKVIQHIKNQNVTMNVSRETLNDNSK